MLKGIPEILSPELLFALAKTGHGDEIVLADANFPTSSICRYGLMEIRADGLSIPQLVESILKLLPLDTHEPNSVVIMDLVESDKARGLQIPMWETYKSLLLQAGLIVDLENMERFAFYEREKKAFAVVATGETSLYGSIILRKAVITSQEQHMDMNFSETE